MEKSNARIILKLFCVFLVASNIGLARAETSAVENAYLKVKAQSEKDTNVIAKSMMIAEIYGRMIRPIQDKRYITKMSDSDLRALYNSANVASFYTQQEQYLNDMTLDLAAMRRRGIDAKHYYADVYGASIALRNFKDAARTAHVHQLQALQSAPLYIDNHSQKAQRTDISVGPGKKLTRSDFVMPKGVEIIVISHPLCHFSRHAADYISAHKEIASVFKSHSIWLVPPDRNLDFDIISLWNKENPNEQMSLAYSRGEWPKITSWATPTFYFFKDGVLVETMIGWPRGGNAALLTKDLRKLDLLPAS